MKRNFISRNIDNAADVKQKMLSWTQQFSIFCFLDNNEYSFSDPAFECLLGAGVVESAIVSSPASFHSLQSLINKNDWVFGHLNYDLKNYIEDLSSSNFDGIQFPDAFFFIPEIIIQLSTNKIEIAAEDPEKIFRDLCRGGVYLRPCSNSKNSPINLTPRLSKPQYLSTVETLRHHILRGDCYEINFCQEFYAENASLEPLITFLKLDETSPNPFSAFYKLENKYLMCASPERYIKRTANHIISQPIKGTSKRELASVSKDNDSRNALQNSAKERSENVMIVDLVRNDLSKVCADGTVRVENLFEIFSFPQVHQMISTVGGELRDDVSFTDIVKATFPMGSMTGAPKKRVMELIEQYEKTKRGLFSGSIGYIKPGGDFDFNVVIRSILYNSSNQYISVQAGSAITFASNPNREYEECLMKIAGMKKVLG